MFLLECSSMILDPGFMFSLFISLLILVWNSRQKNWKSRVCKLCSVKYKNAVWDRYRSVLRLKLKAISGWTNGGMDWVESPGGVKYRAAYATTIAMNIQSWLKFNSKHEQHLVLEPIFNRLFPIKWDVKRDVGWPNGWGIFCLTYLLPNFADSSSSIHWHNGESEGASQPTKTEPNWTK